MGLFERIARVRSGAVWETLKETAKPEWIAEVVACELRHGREWELEVLAYTGEESPWQAQRLKARARVPEGVEPRVGQRLVVKPPRGETGEPSVIWDRPEPELPAMKLPKIP